MAELANPHDRFFKEVLSRPENVRDFITGYLPGDVVEILDASSLDMLKDSFVDEDLREHFSDLLYKATLRDGSGAYVHVLFEHKSYPEPPEASDERSETLDELSRLPSFVFRLPSLVLRLPFPVSPLQSNMHQTHHDLEVWQRAMALVRQVYTATASFPKEELYGLASQMRRAAVSIPSNIAEGSARSTGKEFVQFLYIARGSLMELETQARIARDLSYLPEDTLVSLTTDLEAVFALLSGLIASVQRRVSRVGRRET